MKIKSCFTAEKREEDKMGQLGEQEKVSNFVGKRKKNPQSCGIRDDKTLDESAAFLRCRIQPSPLFSEAWLPRPYYLRSF